MNALAEARAPIAVVVELARVKAWLPLAYAGHIGSPFITLLADNTSILTAGLIVKTSIVWLLEKVAEGGDNHMAALSLFLNNNLVKVPFSPIILI